MIGFAPQVISNIVSGRKSKPSFDILNAILSSFVDVNSEWLLTGKGEMLKKDIEIGGGFSNNGGVIAVIFLLVTKKRKLQFCMSAWSIKTGK